MTVEYHHGEEQEVISCEDGTFFVGCGYTDANGYHIASIENEDAFASIAERVTCRVIDLCFPDGATLHLVCLSSENPSIRAIMKRCTGIKQSELSCKGFSLTVTV